MQESNITLRDIKDIVIINDYSLLWFFLIIIFCMALVFYFIYRYKNIIRRSEKKSHKQIAYQNLLKINFSDTKKAIYTFCVDGYVFVNDENSKTFEDLESSLESYKYKKISPPLEKELVQKMKDFIQGIKVVK